MKISGEKGFTLVETLVVVAIFAVLVIIAAPNFLSTTFPRMKLKSSARDVYTMLQYARGKAVSSTQQYGVQFNLDAVPETFDVVTRAVGASTWNIDTSIAQKSVESGIEIFSVTVGGTEYTTGTTPVISFDPFGAASVADIKLNVTQIPAEQYKVSVASSSGRVTINTSW
ncbi:MAG: Tfp pilus assembly protein FimT/FimU [Thermodesulfobacteriota bacterium]